MGNVITKKEEQNDKIVKPLNDYIVEFRDSMNIGIASIKKAARAYAEAIIRHPTLAPTRFSEQFPEVSATTWDILERIGNGDLHEKAFLLPYATVNKLIHVPIRKQTAMLDRGGKGFEVVNPTTLKTRVIPLSSLSTHQANILFDVEKGKVRSPDEQRKIIKERNDGVIEYCGSGAKFGRHPKYRICGNVCYIAGVEIGRETLKRILAEMGED